MSTLTLTRDGVYRSLEPMTTEQIQRAAPAALQVAAHHSRSDQYQPIATMTVVNALRDAIGVEVFGATQAKSRDATKRAHAKHVLRLRRPCDANAQDVPELLLTNAYDGSTSYKLELGAYRFVCANGLVVGSTWDSASVKHIGADALPEMAEQSARLALKFDSIHETIETWKSQALNPSDIGHFANAAAQLRFDPTEETVSAPDIIRARRTEDRASDLWTIFNRTQEGLVRGGYYKRKAKPDDRGVRARRRVGPVKGIDGNAALNRALWTLTETMSGLVA